MTILDRIKPQNARGLRTQPLPTIMISHVLGRQSGHPHGSKMPGAFKTITDMMLAFVRDYKPRSSKPQQGEVQENEHMLIMFTEKELELISGEIGGDRDVLISQMSVFAERLNEAAGLDEDGFEAVVFAENMERTSSIGLYFYKKSSDPKTDVAFAEDIHGVTGETVDFDGKTTRYRVLEFPFRN